MKKTSDILDVVLLLRLSYASGRDILHGISSFARRERCRWRFHVVNYDARSDAIAELRDALAAGVDGAIAIGLYDPEVEAVFLSSPVPLVVLALARKEWLRRRPGPTAFVETDDAAVGRLGARYLSSLGSFRCFGFVKAGARADGFRSHFAARTADVRTFLPDASGAVSTEALVRWLRELPRPAAVMASTDVQGLQVLKAAEQAGVRVPEELSVLGVDNDELLCEAADPPLASVAVDYTAFGGRAAEALRRLLASPSLPPFALTLPPARIVERASVRPVAPAASLADRAAEFIRRNATKGIGAADVARHLGASRSLLDLRFREVFGESVLATILRVRLDRCARKLLETDLPVGQVARSCGFRDANHAGHLFKRRFGRSMRAWRAQPVHPGKA